MLCIEGVVTGTSSGQREGAGPTMRRELIRVEDLSGSEVRIANVLMTTAMDSYLGSAVKSGKKTKFFVAEQVDHKKPNANILFAISAPNLNYTEAAFWDGERKTAIRQMRLFTFVGWVLAALVVFFFCLTMVAGLLISIVVVPILLISKFAMAKVWRRLRKLNTEAEMISFIKQKENFKSELSVN